MHTPLGRPFLLLAFLLAGTAVVAFPSNSLAYTYQVVTDENSGDHGSYTTYSSGWNPQSTWNGYDYNTFSGPVSWNTGTGPWLAWYPNQAGSMWMCAYVHIPTVSNGGYVYYDDSAQGRKSSGTIYQANYSNQWWYALTDYFATSSHLQINSDSANKFTFNSYGADAVAFHIPSC
jgi:hypothetical protein